MVRLDYFFFHVYGSHAMLHRGECGNCQHGRGCHPGARFEDCEWSGAYPLLARAWRAARALGVPVYPCQHCL
jgi:hypothetical protein